MRPEAQLAMEDRLRPVLDADQSLTFHAALALAVEVPVEQIRTIDYTDDHHYITGPRQYVTGAQLLCVRRPRDWQLFPVPAANRQAWQECIDLPRQDYAMRRAGLTSMRLALLSSSTSGVLTAGSLLDISDDHVDPDDPLIAGLVRLWWDEESAAGMTPEQAWFLLALSPVSGLSEVAEAVGIPRT